MKQRWEMDHSAQLLLKSLTTSCQKPSVISSLIFRFSIYQNIKISITWDVWETQRQPHAQLIITEIIKLSRKKQENHHFANVNGICTLKGNFISLEINDEITIWQKRIGSPRQMYLHSMHFLKLLKFQYLYRS